MKELIDTFQMHICINIYLVEMIGELRLDGYHFIRIGKCRKAIFTTTTISA